MSTGAPTGGTSTRRASSRSSAGRHNHFMEQVIVLQVARGGGVGLAPRPFKDQIIGNKRVTLNIGDYGSESSDVG